MGKIPTKGKWRGLHLATTSPKHAYMSTRRTGERLNNWKAEQCRFQTAAVKNWNASGNKSCIVQTMSQTKGQCLIPGSSCGSKLLRSVFSLCQSKMRPTKGDISVTFASAQATAWAKENSRVMLQWTPCFSSSTLTNNNKQTNKSMQKQLTQISSCKTWSRTVSRAAGFSVDKYYFWTR